MEEEYGWVAEPRSPLVRSSVAHPIRGLCRKGWGVGTSIHWATIFFENHCPGCRECAGKSDYLMKALRPARK